MNEQLLTIDEIAFLLQISPQTVRKLIKNHELPAIKLGHIYRITWQSLQLFMKNKQVK